MPAALIPSSKIAAAPSPVHGLGVFATEPIAVGEIIERCPVLRIPAAQLENLDATLLYEYYFAWDGDGGVALGFGSLYNHSSEPNAEYHKELEANVVVVRALTAIAAGEEITFCYGGPAETS
jgi:SET domain-containing protein